MHEVFRTFGIPKRMDKWRSTIRMMHVCQKGNQVLRQKLVSKSFLRCPVSKTWIILKLVKYFGVEFGILKLSFFFWCTNFIFCIYFRSWKWKVHPRKKHRVRPSCYWNRRNGHVYLWRTWFYRGYPNYDCGVSACTFGARFIFWKYVFKTFKCNIALWW